MAELLGPSQTVPGAVDVRLDDGTIVQTTAEDAQASGLVQRSSFAQQPQPSPRLEPRRDPRDVAEAAQPAQALTPGLDPRDVAAPPAGALSDFLGGGLDPSQITTEGLPAPAPAPGTTLDRVPPSQIPFVDTFRVGAEEAQRAEPDPFALPSMAGSSLEASPDALRRFATAAPFPAGQEIPEVTITQDEAEAAARRADGAAAPGAAPGAARPGARAPGAGLEGIQQRIGETFGEERSALLQAGEAIAEGAVRRTELLRNAEARDLMLAQQRQEAEQVRQQEMDRQEAAFTSARDAIATRRIDPNAFWRERGESARIGAALAIAVGDFSSRLVGGQNAALGIINDAVERNIVAQREELGRDERLLSVQEREIRRIYDRFGDDRTAEAASRALHWESVGRQLESLGANVTDAQAVAGLRQMSAQVARQQGQAEIAFRREQARVAAQAAARRAATRQSGLARQMQLMRTIMTSAGPVVLDEDPEKRALQVAQLRGGVLTPDDRLRLEGLGDLSGAVGGGPQPAPGGTVVVDQQLWDSQTPEQRRVATTAAGAAGDILTALDEAISLRREFGAELFSSEARSRATSINQRIIANARELRRLGTPQQAELAQLAEEFPLATDVGGVEGFIRGGGFLAPLSGFPPLAAAAGGATLFAGSGEEGAVFQDLVMDQLVAAQEQFRSQAGITLRAQGLDAGPEVTGEPVVGPGGFRRADGQ